MRQVKFVMSSAIIMNWSDHGKIIMKWGSRGVGCTLSMLGRCLSPSIESFVEITWFHGA